MMKGWENMMLEKAKRVLLVLPERLGDTLFCTPAIDLLKQYCPNLEIDVICLSRLSSEALQYNPSINHIYITPTKKVLKHLRGYYDLGINIHPSYKASALFSMLKLPIETIPPRDVDVHQAVQALCFVQSLLSPPLTDIPTSGYKLYPQAQHFGKIQELLAPFNVAADEYLVGCHLGCHGIAKRGIRFWRKATHPKVWPLENFLALAEKLQAHKVRLVLTGSPTERVLGDLFSEKQQPAINLIGHTSVLELAALMSSLHVFVAPDTGTLHVACATNVPIVALFGPTKLSLTGPYPMRDTIRILQAADMQAITVDTVAQTVLDIVK